VAQGCKKGRAGKYGLSVLATSIVPAYPQSRRQRSFSSTCTDERLICTPNAGAEYIYQAMNPGLAYPGPMADNHKSGRFPLLQAGIGTAPNFHHQLAEDAT